METWFWILGWSLSIVVDLNLGRFLKAQGGLRIKKFKYFKN